MNASMNYSTDAPLYVYSGHGISGEPRIFVSTLGCAYFVMSVEEARHLRDRLSVVLVQVEDAQKVAETA